MAGQKKEQPVASHLIAARRGIPERFLLKVLKPLVSAQLLLSIKGPNGGYRLARPASEISVLEVLEAVDGPIRGQAPSLGNLQEKDDFQKKLEEICIQSAEQVCKVLSKVHISELAIRDTRELGARIEG
jgi:Rrf2 family protein